jgi:hypothetical protein
MLEETARLVRLKLERMDFSDQLNCCAILKRFPNACCKITAIVYLYYLMKYKSVDSEELFLIANAEIKQGFFHAWAQVSEFHVDLTADQFGREKIIVTNHNPWTDVRTGFSRHKFSQERFNEPYEADLVKICQYIDKE